MSTPRVDVNVSIQGREVFTVAEVPGAASEAARTLTTGAASVSDTHNATSTPKVDKPPVSLYLTMTGSAVQIDLTAAAGLAVPYGATRTLDLTGAKVVDFIITCPSTNVGNVNVAPGAANPYPLFGTGNDIDVGPGRTVALAQKVVATNLPAVSGTVKRIDVTGTSGDKVYVDLYLGT